MSIKLQRGSFVLCLFLCCWLSGSVSAQLLQRRTGDNPPSPKTPPSVENTSEETKRFGQRLIERLKGSEAEETDSKPEPTPKPAANPPLPIKKELPIIEDANKTYNLTSSRKKDATDYVEVSLVLSGKTKQVTNEQKEIQDNLDLKAGFRYEERLLSDSIKPKSKIKSVRDYSSLARAVINVGSVESKPELEKKHSLVVCEIDGKKTTLFSPQGALKSDQVMLIEGILGNTLSIDMLLPSKEVKIGDTWKIPDEAVYSFLDVDAISNHDLEATLTSVANDLAIVEIVGDMEGAYLGALSEMHIREAKYQFDLKSGRINWWAISISESRSISDVGPGLDIVALLQVKISPMDQPKMLTDAYISNFSLEPTGDELLIRYEGGEGPWRFHFARNWYLIEDMKGSTILRMLNDSGELVAQCNMVSMPKVETKSPTSLAEFSENLRKGLGESFGSIASADERVNSSGYKELRVIIDGAVDDLLLRWVYYLLTDNRGNQSVVVFVIHPDKMKQFGNSDELIIDSFRMLDLSL